MKDHDQPVSRRTLVKGAAWTVPAITAATAIPAFAASPSPGEVIFFYGNSRVQRYYNYSTGSYQLDITQTTYQGNTCGFTFSPGATVTNVSITYWLPHDSLVFEPHDSTSDSWSTFEADPSHDPAQGNHGSYYPYTIHYNGTTTTGCGPSYSFTAYPSYDSYTDIPGLYGYFYQIKGTVNGEEIVRDFRTVDDA